jgi:hypothetical protein
MLMSLARSRQSELSQHFQDDWEQYIVIPLWSKHLLRFCMLLFLLYDLALVHILGTGVRQVPHPDKPCFPGFVTRPGRDDSVSIPILFLEEPCQFHHVYHYH